VQAIVWRADAATLEMRFVSQEAEALLRYPLAAWTEQPSFWKEHIHPEDREWAVALRARAGAEGTNYDAEYRMIAADGRVVWVRDAVRARGGERRQGELIGFTTDVTERRRAEEDLRRSRDRLSDLSAHIEWAREEERTGIAREIHDELGQSLTALRMDVSWLRGRLAAPEATAREPLLAKLGEMVELIDDTIGRARRISTELRPGVLDDLGLDAAAAWLAEDFQRRTGVACQAACALPPLEIERGAATALFRILQEALTNVSRHAAATQVNVDLHLEGGRLVLEVRDNGRGATDERPAGRRSLGVLGMMERARRLGGTLTFTSAPGAGTVVQASVPLSAVQRGAAAAAEEPPA
jgi:PAS domain S-box-containing protein